jgi:hypothetical protein
VLVRSTTSPRFGHCSISTSGVKLQKKNDNGNDIDNDDDDDDDNNNNETY